MAARTRPSRRLAARPAVRTSIVIGSPTGLPELSKHTGGQMVSIQVDAQHPAGAQLLELQALVRGSFVQEASRYQRPRSGSKLNVVAHRAPGRDPISPVAGRGG